MLAQQYLADSIRHGVFPPGSRLPGERDLAARIGVSRTTLRQALLRLADENMVSPSSQRGWFVTNRMLSEPPSVLQSFTDMARARNLRPTTEVLAMRVRPSTFDEAERLSIAPAADVLELRRRRSLDDVSVCVDTNTIAVGVATLKKLDFTNRSLYEVLRESCGVVVARCAYTVQAVAATDEIAGLLNLAPGAPVLAGQEITYASDGSPISTGTTIYRGDAYRFQADLYSPLA
jgi:GntR family transcriptional regulator